MTTKGGPGQAQFASGLPAVERTVDKKGVFPPEEPFIPYTCRHTYAKRMLGGYWGKPVTLEVLAGLMGNSQNLLGPLRPMVE